MLLIILDNIFCWLLLWRLLLCNRNWLQHKLLLKLRLKFLRRYALISYLLLSDYTISRNTSIYETRLRLVYLWLNSCKLMVQHLNRRLLAYHISSYYLLLLPLRIYYLLSAKLIIRQRRILLLLLDNSCRLNQLGSIYWYLVIYHILSNFWLLLRLLDKYLLIRDLRLLITNGSL